MKWKLIPGILAGLFMATTAMAYDEPVVNLGYTSFFDGGPPAGPGLYFQDYLQYYTANRFNDNKGNRLPLPQTDLDVTANITQLIYLSKIRLFGGSLGVSALLPWVLKAKVYDGLNNAVLRAQDGAGDLFIGPAIQFDPIMRANGKEPLYVQRIHLDVVAPLGRYRSNYAINPSSNFWSLNPYWAATLWMTSKWSSSIRLHYLWNAKNPDPNISFGPTAQNTQAGQAVFANIATNYGITEQFYLGINGYFFVQTSNTKVNGIGVPDRKERVWAIGPGMLYNISKSQFLFFNLYSEQNAVNRPQGTNAILRYAYHFS